MDYNLIFSDNPYYIIAHLARTTQTAIILIKVFTSYTQYVPLLTKIWVKLFLLKIKSNHKKEKYRSAALELMIVQKFIKNTNWGLEKKTWN